MWRLYEIDLAWDDPDLDPPLWEIHVRWAHDDGDDEGYVFGYSDTEAALVPLFDHFNRHHQSGLIDLVMNAWDWDPIRWDLDEWLPVFDAVERTADWETTVIAAAKLWHSQRHPYHWPAGEAAAAALAAVETVRKLDVLHGRQRGGNVTSDHGPGIVDGYDRVADGVEPDRS